MKRRLLVSWTVATCLSAGALLAVGCATVLCVLPIWTLSQITSDWEQAQYAVKTMTVAHEAIQGRLENLDRRIAILERGPDQQSRRPARH